MQQLSIFKDDLEITIPGLAIIPEYIKSEEESELIRIIDTKPWINDLKRRVQHYGYKYDYRSKGIDSNLYLGPIPNWLDYLCHKLSSDQIFPVIPDQVIINEYITGQGISQHVDCISCFSDTICSLSLNSSCVMDFVHKEKKVPKVLSKRSLLLLSNDARYLWTHGIAARKYDSYQGTKILRQRRLSLTFRKIRI